VSIENRLAAYGVRYVIIYSLELTPWFIIENESLMSSWIFCQVVFCGKQ